MTRDNLTNGTGQAITQTPGVDQLRTGGQLLASFLLLCSSAWAWASGETTAAAEVNEDAVKAELPAGQAGMRVFRDPETGELRAPTLEESRALPRIQPATQVSGEHGAYDIVHPDGSVSRKVTPDGMHFFSVSRHKDGSLHENCDQPHNGVTHD